jgi:3-methylcrotonyl-CoA carboxylase alpha subunit
METRYSLCGKPLTLAASEADGAMTVTVEGEQVEVTDIEIAGGQVTFRVDATTLRAAYVVMHGHMHIAVAGRSFEFIPADDADDDAEASAGHFVPEVSSPMPGKVLDVLVAVGDVLEAGTPVVLMEAMKMETTVRACAASRVVDVMAVAGAMVGVGETLLVLEKLDAQAAAGP